MGLQAYYTKNAVANDIGKLVWAIDPGTPKTVLDMCAGSGNLSKAYCLQRFIGLKDVSTTTQNKPPHVSYIEPDEEPIDQLRKLTDRDPGQVFHMTAEEYVVTYGENNKFDVIFCNPPYGERLGTTSLRELVTDIHHSHLTRFESYFLQTAAAMLAEDGLMVFLIPDTYFKREESARTMELLLHAGIEIFDLRALPVDAYDGALVNTSLWVFRKSSPPRGEPNDLARANIAQPETIFDWRVKALEQVLSHAAAPFYKNRPLEINRGMHGEVHGYTRPIPVKDREEALDLEANWSNDGLPVFSRDESQTTGLIPTSPKPLRALWERDKCMYELTEEGWCPAASQGFSEGIPVSKEFGRAQLAYEYYRQGAIYTAFKMIEGIDLNELRTKYAKLASGSFLQVLRSGSVEDNSLTKDLSNLGMITLPSGTGGGYSGSFLGSFLKIPDGVIRVGDTLVHPQHLSDGQVCKLYSQHKDQFPEVLQSRLEKILACHEIPLERFTLRAPWLPRALIAKCFQLEMNEDGLYKVPQDKIHITAHKSLAAYLNYGKGPYRIGDGDQEVYETQSQRFAARMNAWREDRYHDIRRTVHACYIAAHAKAQLVNVGYGQVRTAKPLHWWQTKDLDFALSGQAILCWDVGLGKTLGGIAAAVAHPGKSCIVVPKPVISKWAREIDVFFPTVKYAMLGFRKSKRAGKYILDVKNLVDQAAEVFFSPEVQIVLTTHEVFTRMQVRKEDITAADEQDAADLTGATGASDGPEEKDSNTPETRTQEKRRKQHVQHAASRNYQFGGEFTFTDLPLSTFLLVVDEGHRLKSLFPMPSTGWGNQLVMAGNCGKSKRSRDMKIKCDLIRAAGGKTLCLTATPVNNSVAEIFNMLRIFAPAALERRGIKNTQQLMDTYCIIEPVTAVSPSGNIKSGDTIKGFKNLADMRSIWQEAMITRTGVDVKLRLPAVQEHIIRVKPTWAIQDYIDEQKEALQKSLEGETSDEKKVHIFSVLSNIDKVASYPPTVEIAENPKGTMMVENVWEIYCNTDGGQIIFSDLMESQEGIRMLLENKGIPSEEIGILNGTTAKSIESRLKIQDMFNEGEYRIVIGGAIASEGIDLQRNTVAIHFNNLSWEGQTIHQRKGRGIRQGNQNDLVQVFYYLLESSTDIYRFATTKNKAHWWESLRQAQTDRVTENVFSEPMSDELIASLALDPGETLALLRKRRRGEELKTQLKRFRSTLKRMLVFLDSQDRASNLDVLQELEATLRKLSWIPEPIVNEGLQRAQFLAQLKEEVPAWRAQKTWTRHIGTWKDVLSYQRYISLTYSPMDVFLLLQEEDSDEVQFHKKMDDLVKWELRERVEEIPRFAATFGKKEVVAQSEETDQDEEDVKILVFEVEDEESEATPATPEPTQIITDEPEVREPVAVAAMAVAAGNEQPAKNEVSEEGPGIKEMVADAMQTMMGLVQTDLPFGGTLQVNVMGTSTGDHPQGTLPGFGNMQQEAIQQGGKVTATSPKPSQPPKTSKKPKVSKKGGTTRMGGKSKSEKSSEAKTASSPGTSSAKSTPQKQGVQKRRSPAKVTTRISYAPRGIQLTLFDREDYAPIFRTIPKMDTSAIEWPTSMQQETLFDISQYVKA